MHRHPASSDFVDPAALLLGALDAFLPAARVNVADWTAQNRWVSGARAGLWRHDTAPYLVEPMLALTNPLYTTVVVVGPGQTGKTALAENWLAQTIATDPAQFGWYLNTDDVVKSYVKNKITDLIETHQVLSERKGRGKTDDSLSFKRFRGMIVEFLAAVPSNLRNKTFQRIVADEIDGYDPAFGDPKNMLDVRRTTYGRDSMLLMMSHPDLATGTTPDKWQRGIMASYADSTRCTWWWPCVHCSAWSSPNPGISRFCELVYPPDAPLDQVRTAAHLLCPVNGCIIDDADRLAMTARGRWIGRGETIDQDGIVTGTRDANDIAGYWIVGVMSPFLLSGMGGLAAARVQAERNQVDATDRKSVREVMSKQWGIPDEPKARPGQLDASVLAERAANELTPLGIVPDGVRFLTASIDVQANRFELLVRGWGIDAESWVIDHQRIEAAPATSAADWDKLLLALANAGYRLADDSGRVMRIRAAGFDSGGEPGVTEQAYAAWRRAKRLGQTKRLGVTAGRDAWTILPLKGAGSLAAKRLTVVYPDTARRDRRAAGRGEVPLGLFGTNAFKSQLAGQLAIAEPGAGYIHIPAVLRDGATPTFFDQLVAELLAKSGMWVQVGPRNEALDLMVMAAAMAHLHGLGRFNWDRPPSWAAPWDSNVLVGLAPVALPAPDAPPAPLAIASNLPAAAGIAPPPPRRSFRSLASSAAR